ncbi:hypothetical protein [Nostoc sp. 'Peltigera malacea cyanobiont' DB3992]|uniref:hypothetical protein n=1 Tax=Nostoc sp. 'Peltigera malacea cyanobiont' DB3992 TaxID=1206980 RepID=UPI000C0486BA|nr:hypothetical protein [Nostoc sp. 'Peltigera malacea cyanobiont' DB3992]PHM11649.1 hypothetical protein CK516_01535 [Nostoc sp. 'Peltigera malacea cyanobiont' DB3992]
MNLTDIKPVDIITHVEQNFNRSQATGLNALIVLALREQTSVAYQHKEYCFEDIPEQIVAVCDSLDEYHLLFLVVEITSWLLGEVKSAQSIAAQPIDDQDQPTLLSDY